MEIKCLVLGELQTNCYLVYDSAAGEGIIIDPADDANFIIEQVLALNFQPTSIVASHGHFDHLLAADEFSMAFNIPLLIHEKDLFLVKDLQKRAEHWLGRKIIEKPPQKIVFVKDKDKIMVGKEFVEIIHTPGHSPGSICLYSAKQNFLFTGDTLFSEGVGRTDFSYGSENDLKKSLQTIHQLPPTTIIYPGHGPSTTMAQAKSSLT